MVTLHVNGDAHTLDDDPDDCAIDLVRDRLGLTGTKSVCGAGFCGACTVLLDGEAAVSCLLPARAVNGRALTTVEGLAEHPVVRAFAAHDALRCGFCTPGFVVEAAAFHDTWRATHARPEAPDDATIAAALAGHLCRCGAYPEIYAAVRAACAGSFDAPGQPSGPRYKAAEKITGAARYTVDIRLPGQLHGAILRSPHPHARVLDIDLAPALAIEGVHAAVDLLPRDRYVRYLGHEVAAVAAVDRATAERALAAVRVRYQPLAAVIGMAAATARDAPRVYAEGGHRPPGAVEETSVPPPWKGNTRGPVDPFSTGRHVVAQRLDAARSGGDPFLVEGVYTADAQSYTTFEPHAAVAHWDGKTLTVHVSTQAVAHVASEIAERFDLRVEQVRTVAEHGGGGFGAKAGLTAEIVAAVGLTLQSGRPVLVTLDRLAELSHTGYRPGARIQTSLLVDAAANLRVLRLVAYAESGIAVGTNIASVARLIYPSDAKELLDYDVVTNAAPGAPFRRPSGPLTCFALEQAVDEAARRLGRDPIALRRRWDTDPGRQRLYAWAERLNAWRDRARLPRTGRFRRGIGVAAAAWLHRRQPDCSVALGVTAGRIIASTAVRDPGTANPRAGHSGTGSLCLAEVEVDTALGRTVVQRVHLGLTTGRLAAPELALGQVRGAVIQGVGLALHEQREIDPDTGLVLAADLADYRIPGIADVPEIVTHFDRLGVGHVPGGGVELSEVAAMPVAAAIANAVQDATGRRPYALPIRPDRLLSTLHKGGRR